MLLPRFDSSYRDGSRLLPVLAYFELFLLMLAALRESFSARGRLVLRVLREAAGEAVLCAELAFTRLLDEVAMLYEPFEGYRSVFCAFDSIR